MKKENFDFLKKEFGNIGIAFLAIFIIFKLSFYNESLLIVFRLVFSLFWLFGIPGYFAMIYWKEKLDFLERFIIGFAICAGIIGTLSYYIGLAGLNLKYHSFLLPLSVIITSVALNFKKTFS